MCSINDFTSAESTGNEADIRVISFAVYRREVRKMVERPDWPDFERKYVDVDCGKMIINHAFMTATKWKDVSNAFMQISTNAGNDIELNKDLPEADRVFLAKYEKLLKKVMEITSEEYGAFMKRNSSQQ